MGFTTMKNACFFFTEIRFSALDFHTFLTIERHKFDVISLADTAYHIHTHYLAQFINYFPHFLRFFDERNGNSKAKRPDSVTAPITIKNTVRLTNKFMCVQTWSHW